MIVTKGLKKDRMASMLNAPRRETPLKPKTSPDSTMMMLILPERRRVAFLTTSLGRKTRVERRSRY
jgi:hypothetical protein